MEIEFCCSLEKTTLNSAAIAQMLPEWKTQVLDVSETNSCIKLFLRIAASTVDDVKEWMRAYEELSSCTYTIRSTESCSGHFLLFKQRLHCQHNTRSHQTNDSGAPNFTKNTNCPSTITIKLRTIRKKYRGKDQSKAPNPDMPCEIMLIPTHNHSVLLRFRKVASETDEKLMMLFRRGHSPATALETLKMDIHLNHENFKTVLADRKFCPNYNYCYRLYIRDFVEKYGAFEDSKEFLIKRLEEYNIETDSDGARVAFDDSGSYVICICPPFLRRVHEYIKAASEITFMDSYSTIDKDGSRIYLLFTHSECGGLPLAVIITSTREYSNISLGFHLLKNMSPTIFGGNLEGPKVFITNDSNEQTAVNYVWSKSKSVLCTFRVLRTVWKWLKNPNNEIQLGDQPKLFQGFRSIMFAATLADVDVKYMLALHAAKKYPNYQSYLNTYWERRELWTLSYRSIVLTYEPEGINFLEASVRLLNGTIFERTKTFNLVQMVDFMLNQFMRYYEKRLLDAAHNRPIENANVTVPPSGVLDRIQQLSEKVYLVPCEASSYQYYIVSVEALMCTCQDGSTGKICKHIHWLYCCINSQKNGLIHNKVVRTTFYIVATGNYENTSDDSTSPSTADTFLPMELLTKGRNLINKIANQYTTFLEVSPLAAIDGLEKLDQHLSQLKTVSEFVAWSSCDFTLRGPIQKNNAEKSAAGNRRQIEIVNGNNGCVSKRKKYRLQKRRNHFL